MKKKLLIIFSIIVLIIGGYFILNEYKKKRLLKKAQEKPEKYVMDNYMKVESDQITTNNYCLKPMVTLGVGGRINEEDNLYFYTIFLIVKNKVGELRTIVKAHNFPDRKDEEMEDE